MGVFKPKRRRNGVIVLSKYYSGDFPTGRGTRKRVALHVTQKDVAEEKLRRIKNDYEREKLGMRPLEMSSWVGTTPLASQLSAYVADLRARQSDEKYILETQRKIEAMGNDCKWACVQDVSVHSFLA
jgi:hypothetical protein